MGVKPIQTVDIGDLNTVMPQHGSNGEETHGFGPEVVGRKVVNPGVDAKNVGIVFHCVRLPVSRLARLPVYQLNGGYNLS